VIEVAETSLAYDLSAKATLYADSDVDEYWVIDLGRSLVHVHRGRTGGRWTSITTLGADDHIASIGLAGSSFTLAEVLRDA
jgi:Uma2 family endonuclease